MKREWKPGDVAMVDGRAMVHVGHDPGNRCWHGAMANGDLDCRLAHENLTIRPLVVIDPEDREKVELLCGLFLMGHEGTAIGNVTDLQAALREFANPTPPKPAEPTGLGAVVEGANGVQWVRSGKSFTNPNWRACGGDEWVRYSNIPAVRVLSEGVS